MSASLLEVHRQCVCQCLSLSFHCTTLPHIKCFCSSKWLHYSPRKLCYSSYIIVRCHAWSIILIIYLVNFTGCEIIHDYMNSIPPMHCPLNNPGHIWVIFQVNWSAGDLGTTLTQFQPWFRYTSSRGHQIICQRHVPLRRTGGIPPG